MERGAAGLSARGARGIVVRRRLRPVASAEQRREGRQAMREQLTEGSVHEAGWGHELYSAFAMSVADARLGEDGTWGCSRRRPVCADRR